MKDKRILILGVGNWLMADEGVGVHLARYMETLPLPDGVDVLDGGTGGFHLLGHIEQYAHVIMVDATLDNQVPGSFRLIRPRFASDFPQAMSTHEIGLKDLISALHLLNRMPDIYLYVVSIATIQEQGIELSAEVQQSIPALSAEILQLVNQLQQVSD